MKNLVLKNYILLIIIAIFSLGLNTINAQNVEPDRLFQNFLYSYKIGDLLTAEKNLLLILNSGNKISIEYRTAVLNNLGATCSLLGKFKEALEYYNAAAQNEKNNNSISLGDIYTNIAIIHGFQKSYSLAFEYFNKAIRIYTSIETKEAGIYQSLSSSYLNSGVIFLEISDFKSGLANFIKSAEIKSKYNLPGLGLVYLNIAKTYVKTNNAVNAEAYYLKSIKSITSDFDKNYFRLAEVYFDYGRFLRSEDRLNESLNMLKNALNICLINYGNKHTLVSLSYKMIGDHYKYLSQYDSALVYYQRSLIAVVNNFNDQDIFKNPSVDSTLFDIRLLDNLKSKAIALERLASIQVDPELKMKSIGKSLETVELALGLIDRIRNNYLTEESRIYLAENEKETWISAIHIAKTLYGITSNKSLLEKMHSFVQRSKAAVLRDEISGNELLFAAGVPDSISEKQKKLAGNIAAYNNLIIEESRRTNPDSGKISLWKDDVFEMNRENERMKEKIKSDFPLYSELLMKTEPAPLSEIQKKLKNDETVVDYMLSNQYTDGKRKLYIFIITSKNLFVHESLLDTAFIKNAGIIRRANLHYGTTPRDFSFQDYTGALNYMYVNLIRDIIPQLSGKRLIIIPDEEIGWLPFDAFAEETLSGIREDYEGIPFLINNYTISYGYSSSLIFSRTPGRKYFNRVYAFSPGYLNGDSSAMNLSSLQGASREIEAIYKWFGGKKYTGNMATETIFRSLLPEQAVLHLAMHSISDTVNSKYSYLMFDTEADTVEDGKLFNYEISLSRVRSPMVVLSACNSGTGKLYHGEGLMSLARGFILAGASSVIRTSWEVNDEVSESIITRFYYHLSGGKGKDEALRLAKIDFIRKNPPYMSNPYYWAAYELVGDNEPVACNKRFIYWFVLICIMAGLLTGGIRFFYRRRRNIFSDLPR